MNTKTQFFKLFIVFMGLSFLWSCASQKEQTAQRVSPWSQLDSIRGLIQAPEFPDRELMITDYGAVGDGSTKNTEAFRQAIEECNAQGGGTVVVPEGTFLTGAIHLLSNVELHLEDSATILFSRDTADYLPMVFTRWEGMELMNYSPFIYAYEQENIAVTGNGTLDGNANNEYWWPWCGSKDYGWQEGVPRQQPDRDSLHVLNDEQVPPQERKFGAGHYLRPNFIQTYKCKNVLLSDFTMMNSPMWNIHPVLSENVTVEGVTVRSLGPNNDGCNPESSKNVLIRNCYFDTGDDCIAIKSGRNADGRRINVPSENLIIEDCEMKEGHGGVVIGSEISGGARNVFAQNCSMDSPNLDRVLRIKTSSQRGGVIENIYMRDVQVGTFREAAIKCNMFYEPPGDFMPVIRNIEVENLQVKDGGKYGVLVAAYAESPVENVRIINSNIQSVDEPFQLENMKDLHITDVEINGKVYEDTTIVRMNEK
ncbi:glycoside hydrolase family 28 protein [Catalinimonas sp. 4WD22]|uniref:glycoside hydrolase family 28 protein n=1 Tax=Catalinimonas locisalis TaxID=3133978 RepID=UPI003100BE23